MFAMDLGVQTAERAEPARRTGTAQVAVALEEDGRSAIRPVGPPPTTTTTSNSPWTGVVRLGSTSVRG